MEDKKEEKKEEVKTLNPLLDEVKAERMTLEKVRTEARELAAKLEQLQSNQLLSGTAGIRTEEPVKEETSKEYADRVMKNEIK